MDAGSPSLEADLCVHQCAIGTSEIGFACLEKLHEYCPDLHAVQPNRSGWQLGTSCTITSSASLLLAAIALQS